MVIFPLGFFTTTHISPYCIGNFFISYMYGWVCQKITNILFFWKFAALPNILPTTIEFHGFDFFSTSKFQKTGFKHHDEEKTDTKFKTTSADV